MTRVKKSFKKETKSKTTKPKTTTPAPRRRQDRSSIATLSPLVFTLDEKEKYLEFLATNGYVVIGGVLQEEEREIALGKFRKDWTTVSPRFDFGDKTTWNINNSPMMYAKGI